MFELHWNQEDEEHIVSGDLKDLLMVAYWAETSPSGVATNTMWLIFEERRYSLGEAIRVFLGE
jgi:hypothetical protein